MKAPLYNTQGVVVKEIEIPNEVFGVLRNDALLHQVFHWYEADRHFPWAHTKTRADVSGGGRKPWRQKGTGRARHGSIRSPIWRGGGATFGPRRERIYAQTLPNKMRGKAVLVALSQKWRDAEIRILEHCDFLSSGKTRAAEDVLRRFLPPRRKTKYQTALLIFADAAQAYYRSVRNLPYADAIEARNLNVKELLTHRFILLTPQAIDVIAKTFLSKNVKKPESVRAAVAVT